MTEKLLFFHHLLEMFALLSVWIKVKKTSKSAGGCMFVPFTSNLCTKLSKPAAGCHLISTLPKTIPLIGKSIHVDQPEGCLYGRRF